MGSPLLRTERTASLACALSVTVTVPPALVYLQALSKSTATDRWRRVALPRTVIPLSMAHSHMSSRSKATASNVRASPSTRRLRSTMPAGPSEAWAPSGAGRARSSISVTRPCMRSASTWVLSIHWRWLAMVPPPRCRRMALLARMTVSGVFSSWDASAMNCCCWAQARCTGRSAQREKTRFSRNSRPKAPRPTAVSTRASERQPSAAPPSAKATMRSGPASCLAKYSPTSGRYPQDSAVLTTSGMARTRSASGTVAPERSVSCITVRSAI